MWPTWVTELKWPLQWNGFTKWSQLKNPDISGAIFTLSLSIRILNSQCVEGARDVRVLLLTLVIIKLAEIENLHHLPTVIFMGDWTFQPAISIPLSIIRLTQLFKSTFIIEGWISIEFFRISNLDVSIFQPFAHRNSSNWFK